MEIGLSNLLTGFYREVVIGMGHIVNMKRQTVIDETKAQVKVWLEVYASDQNRIRYEFLYVLYSAAWNEKDESGIERTS